MKAKYTIREISLVLVLLLIPSVGFAVDDTTISVIDDKASRSLSDLASKPVSPRTSSKISCSFSWA